MDIPMFVFAPDVCSIILYIKHDNDDVPSFTQNVNILKYTLLYCHLKRYNRR